MTSTSQAALLARLQAVDGTAADKAAVVSFVVTDPPMSPLDVGTKLDLEGIAVRTGHHCCMPLMERFGLDQDQAFAVLLRYSQDNNLKLRRVADILVETRSLPD